MKKSILISLMVLYINIGKAQDCKNDVSRSSSYEYMEVYNYTTEKYEKFRNAKTIQSYVTINSNEKMITLKDAINNYNKEFYINDCFVTDSSVVYNCLDIDKNKKCTITFSSSNDCYRMTVKYFMECIMYRMKRIKIGS